MAEEEREGRKVGRLYIDVEYDPKVTDLDSVADALDRVLDTALSTYGLLEEYGSPRPQAFYVETPESVGAFLQEWLKTQPDAPSDGYETLLRKFIDQVAWQALVRKVSQREFPEYGSVERTYLLTTLEPLKREG